MPTYEYACTACGHRLEAVQSFSDDPLTVCPECAGALRKVYGAVGIVLKGSGFYKTDSRAAAGANGSKKKSDSGESSTPAASPTESGSGTATKTEGSGAGSSGTTGTDTKPAAATAS